MKLNYSNKFKVELKLKFMFVKKSEYISLVFGVKHTYHDRCSQMLNVVKGQIIVHDKRLCALVEKGKPLGFL